MGVIPTIYPRQEMTYQVTSAPTPLKFETLEIDSGRQLFWSDGVKCMSVSLFPAVPLTGNSTAITT